MGLFKRIGASLTNSEANDDKEEIEVEERIIADDGLYNYRWFVRVTNVRGAWNSVIEEAGYADTMLGCRLEMRRARKRVKKKADKTTRSGEVLYEGTRRIP